VTTGVIWWGKMRLAPRAELLRVLMLPDFDRADAIGSYWESQDPHLRRAPDRLRGVPDAPGGAGRDAAGAPS